MLDWLTQASAFGVFLVIAGIGFAFLVISLVFGEVFGHIGDHDFEHALDTGGPGFFSTRILSVFVTSFGGFGAISTSYGLSPLAASGVGFAGGMVFGSAIYAFARFLYSQQSSTDVTAKDILGQNARVTVAIPAGGLGQVRCRVGEELVDKIARSQDGEPIAENSVVRVEELLGETAVVKRQ